MHMKLVMIMVLLILSLMTVVGTFLINSVMAFYLEEFYTQMSRVFDQNQALSRNLETEVTSDEDGAQAILSIMEAYYGDLGLDSRSRTLYILDGETGAYLTGTDEEEGRGLEYDSPNLTRALVEREEGTEANIAADYMDVALPITRGDNQYVIYILDNKATVNSLISQIFGLILESLVFGLIISILLSFLLSKTMIIPIQRLTEGPCGWRRGTSPGASRSPQGMRSACSPTPSTTWPGSCGTPCARWRTSATSWTPCSST